MYNYYDKSNIELFALKTLAKSFNKEYHTYISPRDTDDFDFISRDGSSALEISLVISKNENNAYVYQKEKFINQKNATYKKIKNVSIDNKGHLKQYYGGSILELCCEISKRIDKKRQNCRKAN